MITRFCLICIFLSGTCSIKAQSFLQQADSLLTAGQYLEASVAYERVLFSETAPEVRFAAASGKTQTLKLRGRYTLAIDFLNTQIQQTGTDSLLFQLRQEQILCAYLAGQFENTISLTDRIAYIHPDLPLSPVTQAVRILSLNELQRWPEAAAYFKRLAYGSGQDTTLITAYDQLPKLKSAKKAQWLSTFIPGAGQFYAGRPGEAVLSILVQSAGLYFGVVSFMQHYYLSAWGVGAALFGSFHAGGVRRAEVLVNQYNAKKINAFNEKLKEQTLQLAGQQKE